MRGRLEDALKEATLARDQRAMSTLRLILAALRDRDIAERSKGNLGGLTDEQIVALLHSMVRQRRESIRHYENGNRPDLARQEAEEIVIIEQFMPPQMSEAEVEDAVVAVIAEIEARNLKDMGRVMAVSARPLRRANGLRQGGNQRQGPADVTGADLRRRPRL